MVLVLLCAIYGSLDLVTLSCTSGKNFIKITGIEMGAAKSTETKEELESCPYLLPMNAVLFHNS